MESEVIEELLYMTAVNRGRQGERTASPPGADPVCAPLDPLDPQPDLKEPQSPWPPFPHRQQKAQLGDTRKTEKKLGQERKEGREVWEERETWEEAKGEEREGRERGDCSLNQPVVQHGQVGEMEPASELACDSVRGTCLMCTGPEFNFQHGKEPSKFQKVAGADNGGACLSSQDLCNNRSATGSKPA